MKEDILFKKAALGGFRRGEVIDYIQQLKEKQITYRKMIDEKDVLNKNLTADNMALAEKVEKLCSEADYMNGIITKLTAENEQLKENVDVLSQNKVKDDAENKAMVEETISKCDTLVSTATKAAQQLENNAKNKINHAKNSINSNKSLTAEQITEILDNLVRDLG